MLLENGTIRTMDSARPVVPKLNVDDGLIAEESARSSGGERVDLGGRCVLPGFTDSHTHFPTWAMTRSWLDLERCHSAAEVRDLVGDAAARSARDAWLIGYGWTPAQRERSSDSPRRELDLAAADHPVALWSKDMHTYWLNSAALARARATMSWRDGLVETDSCGEPTGILREAAAWAFHRECLDISRGQYVDAVARALPEAHAMGVTAIHDKDGPIGAPEIWHELRGRDGLTIRVWQSVPPSLLVDYVGATDPADEWLRVGYVKLFVDGSLGSCTALMLDGSGVTTTNQEDILEAIRQTAYVGWPIAIHAIGDRANRLALDAFAETEVLWRPRELRQRIEHVQHVAHQDMRRFASLGIACSVQFADAVLSRDAVDHLPAEIAAGSFAFRDLNDSGAMLVNGSDAPLTPLDPLLGLRAAVTRTLNDREPWRPEQALSRDRALAASIVHPAWLAYEEHRRGRLAAGQFADLVVLNRDPMLCTESELSDLHVVATMVDGQWVYNPPPW